MKLQGKTALVTGGATGIGYGIAKALAAEGCRVAISGRREEVLKSAAAEWTGQPAMIYRACDVADRAGVDELFDWATKQLGRIDILVNSAGTNIKNRSMAEMRPEQFDEVMAANSTGIYNCMYAVLPQMKQRQDGIIINISSISGKRAFAIGGIAYVASKFAMSGMSAAIANEVNKSGVRVTTIYPGEVDTPILEKRPKEVSAEQRALILKPEDFSDIVVAICCLPKRAHVPELILKPTHQDYQ
ncbi:MAG: SDR family oxidoreductase [Planctomycetes bacterium]|nr:SDR family oxidoreductase [Planctomycetota bacterium]